MRSPRTAPAAHTSRARAKHKTPSIKEDVAMRRVIRWFVGVTLVAFPLAAQQSLSDLTQAQQVLILADSAGAQTYAKSLYNDAAHPTRFRREHMTSPSCTR